MKLWNLVAVMAMVGLISGCASYDYDMRPDAAPDTAPTAVAWSITNNTSLAAATSELVIAGFPRSETSAQELLGKLKGAYQTDPYVMTQVGAVSQWVMRPGLDKDRKTWTQALLKTAENTSDTYMKMTCLDQLRWCGSEDDVARIRAIGEKGDKSVTDFSEMVVRELTGKSIGL